MNAKRYRIGINKRKMFNWQGWYSNYESDSQASIKLAEALKKDLKKFRVYEVQPNVNVPPAKRLEIIRAALSHLSKTTDL